MANAIYPKWKTQVMQFTANNALTGTGATGVYTALVHGASYAYNAAHDFYSTILTSPDAVIGTDQEIGSKTFSTPLDGVFDGADLTYTAVANTNGSIDDLILYIKNAGANTTWRLLAFFDSGITGLPVTPNGGNITVTWNASGIFQLSDVEAKENVQEIARQGDLGLYEYNYAGSSEPCVGLIAQEVEKVLPSAVTQFRGRKVVNYDAVIDRMAA